MPADKLAILSLPGALIQVARGCGHGNGPVVRSAPPWAMLPMVGLVAQGWSHRAPKGCMDTIANLKCQSCSVPSEGRRFTVYYKTIYDWLKYT